MGKKVVGLVLSVALLMVVLSGCFLLPKPDTIPPVVAITSPANGGNFEVLPNGSKDVTVKASVTAHSPIQSVTFALTSANFSQTVSANGPIGQTSGMFTYTFTGLTPGKYSLSVEAYSSARFPGRASSLFGITATTVYENPVVGDITLTPNYQGTHYVTNEPITFSAKVTNPNNTGTLNVAATVNGEAAGLVSSNNGVYTFTYTPTAAGTYTFAVNAVLTVGSKTYTGSNSKTEHVYVKPAVSNLQPPEDYSVATENPSFTFTTTDGVTAYLSVNESTSTTYTSASPITNLVPNQWNTLTLTFDDPWNNPLSTTSTVHVLGVQPSNPADTPYVFLIDKNGHVVNTNDWIHKNAGDNIDLYGYILKGENPITKYTVKELYLENKNSNAPLSGIKGNGDTISSTSLTIGKSVLPLEIHAYLFNPQATNTYIKFDINVNDSANVYLRYNVAKADKKLDVTVNAIDTYEGAPATISVIVNNPIQPITKITLATPTQVEGSFVNYTATTAYKNPNEKGLNTISTTASYVVKSKKNLKLSDYGGLATTTTWKVAFYGPSGTYQVGATVTAVANQNASATTNYVVQADTSAPTIKIENSLANSATVTINGTSVKAYYGSMSVTATITDDHAIYWAKFESENAKVASPLIVKLSNDATISNYGSTTVTTTATVDFTETGHFTIWAVASDKHFDPTNFSTGNTANSVMSISGIYDNNAPTANLVGGKYDIDATSEYYSFTIEATDGNGVGLAETADVIFTPINGGTPTTVTAQLDPQTPGYYKVLVNTDKLDNIKYSVAVTVMDKLYGPISNPALKEEHETMIETGYVTVHHNYPNVSLFVKNTELSATSAKTISTDVFKIRINDPQFPWDWIDKANYKNYVKITLAGPNEVFEPKTTLLAKYHTPGSTVGYLEVEVPEIYLNDPATTANVPATVTMQVNVYDNVQPDKAIFGQATGKFVPSEPLFTSEPVVTLGSEAVAFDSSTPVVAISNPSDFDAQVTLSGLAQKEGMEITFYANGVKVGTAPASDGTYTLSISINPDWQDITLTAIYAPTATVTYTAHAANVSNYYSYSYKYTIGTFRVLGDTIAPSATITANGVTANSSTVIDKTNDVELAYSVNGVAFYRHDGLAKYYADLNKNTTINGIVTLTTANGPTVFATATLGATDLLSATAADFTTGSKYEVFANKLSNATSAGIYNINFTAVDPFRNDTLDRSATVVVDLAAPVLSDVELNGEAIADSNTGTVTTIANGDTLTVQATDDTGVATTMITVKNLLYANNTKDLTVTMTSKGIATFKATASANVELPTYVGAELQNLPYEVTFTAKDIAGRNAAEVTRLFVTNVDHNPNVSKFILKSANTLLVRLPEPMWAENFKLFTAYSTTFGGTITSNDITPVTPMATYNGHAIAREFLVTFSSDIWSDQAGTNEWGDLSNVRMLDANNDSIKDLAGNTFVIPVSHTIIPPTLSVTPLATVVGKNQPVTFSIVATSAAGIKQTVGYFNGQTNVLNTADGQLTFTSPNLTGTYPATFVTTDKSLDENTATATKSIYVNGTAPSASFTNVSTIVAYGITVTITGEASVGDTTGSNCIKSIVVEDTTTGETFAVTFTKAATTSWTATLTGLAEATNDIQVTVVDLYANSTPISIKIYADNSVPTITVSFKASNSNTGDITNGSSETIYVATPASFTWKVTTDSGTAASVTANITGLATNSTYVSSTVTIPASGQYTISIVATNPVSNKANTFIATRTVVIDNATPMASLTLPPTLNLANLNTAVATYTATDANFESAALEINGYPMSVDEASPATVALNDSAFALDGINGATVTATLTVVDLAGNATSATADFYVDTVAPTIASVVASTTTNVTVINIKFSEQIATTTAFSPNNIVFTYNTTTYVASDITYAASCITVKDFTTGLSAGDLPGAVWTVTVGNNVTDSASNTVSGTGTYDNQ